MREDLFPNFIRQHRSHVGLDITGGDRVDGDGGEASSLASALTTFTRAGLGGGVVGLAGVADDADHRADLDDAPGFLAQHDSGGRLAGHEGAAQIDLQNLVPVDRPSLDDSNT